MTLPALGAAQGLTKYLTAIKEFPLLTAEEEIAFGRRLRERDDEEAAYQLVTSHLRLVAKIAMRYRGYGLPIADVISEGNIGLMQAVKRFDPDRGFRLATYATWWIKATIQDFILRSWSIVKIAASSTQKRLFFNLRRLKSRIAALEEGDMRPDQISAISERLNVPAHEVVEMNRRLLGDMSLNTASRNDDDEGLELQERLADEIDLEETVLERAEFDSRKQALLEALGRLTPRERRIVQARWLSGDATTLDDLGQEFGISRERIRQIEARAIEKVRSMATGLVQSPSRSAISATAS
jgi:RNA polymerase sigma-32 factor